VDHNRCGIPLIEVVTEPELHSSEEAVAFLKTLRGRLLFAGVSDCKMEEGSLRCDVNLSIRKKGDTALGVRTEMKNLNSFSAVKRAIDAEFLRQVQILENGEEIFRETRRLDETTGETVLLRRKETASDYRFLPEPDLPPFRMEEELIASLADTLPEMPEVKKQHFQSLYGVSDEECDLLLSEPFLAELFERSASQTLYPKLLVNLLLGDLLTKLCGASADPSALASVATLWGEGKVNSTAAKRLAMLVAEGETDPLSAMERLDLSQNSDPDAIRGWIESVLEQDPSFLASYRKGKTNVVKAISGAVMAASRGKANPVLLAKLLAERLTKL
jgi:aspartyl-tRNA(Asn)/glutamyl-tRNA(Gln) amidotransferase subunit B